MRALLKFAATTVAAASLLLGTTVLPASAVDKPVNVTSVKVVPSYGGNGISSKSKTYIVKTKAKIGKLATSATVYADVYRGSKKVDHKVQIGYVYASGSKYLNGSVYAKSKWGRGVFTLKNVRVVHDGSVYKDTSWSGGSFRMKSAIEGKLKYDNVLLVQANGSKKSVKIGLRCYNPGGWESCSGMRAKFQYKTSSGWKTRNTVRMDKRGLKTFSFTTGKRHKYRVTVAPTTWVVGGTTSPTSLV